MLFAAWNVSHAFCSAAKAAFASGGGGNISVVSYDWDSGGGITQAGVSVVPEPAATAAIAALLAGGAAFFNRRRRKAA